MSLSLFARIKTLALGLLAIATLSAQVDSKLATTTDLLDVYKSGGSMPEMLTVFDFSGSMQNMFWHSKYWTNLNSDNGNNVTINTTTGIVSASMGGSITATGRLVDPSGTVITTLPITYAVVKRATHARLTAAKTSGGRTYTRTLDIPIAWALFQVPATLPAAGAAPVSDFIVDPKSTSSVQFDTVYSLANTNILNGTRIGLFTYNPDYLYWLFWGNVVKADDGNSYNTTPWADSTGVLDDRKQAPPGGGIFTTGTAGLGGSYPAGGKYVIPGVYDPSYGSASSPSTTVWADKRGTTFNNGIPAGTRCMFLKKAVLSVWFDKQDKVLWAYRFLDNSTEPDGTPDSTNFGTAQRNLTRFKPVTSGIDASVSNIQRKGPSGSTPLVAALANAYAQLAQSGTNSSPGSNPGSVFDQTNTGKVADPCRASFVIIFTDGLANNEYIGANEVAPNATTTTILEPALKALPFSSLDDSWDTNSNYNIWSLAAVAAHGNDNGTGNANQMTTGSGNPSAFAPFHVMNRGSEGTSGRKITTMTVGLSLAGSNTSSINTGGKGPLLRTALYGDPSNTDSPSHTAKFDLQHSVAYGKTPTGDGIATNFFDASDPGELIKSLAAILAKVTSANTSITAPTAPLVGLNLGNRLYLGRFQSSNAGQGSIWEGDLLMTGIGLQSDGSIGIKDKTGAFTTVINAGNAVASASTMLLSKGWKNRNIFTVIPGTTIPGGGLDLTASNQAFSDQNNLLTGKVMGVSTSTSMDAAARSLIRFIRGASKAAQDDLANPTSISDSRVDIMGDILNSSPAAVEYDPALIPSSSPLSALWSSYAALNDPRFRVIFVGDNQGHFHAFGEISGFDSAGLLQASMDELWSFVPPELLNAPSVASITPKLSRLQQSGNDHIYTMDGSPFIYFKDMPVSGMASGNGRVDSGDTIRVIVGMRKGGRSYYAFDVLNPGAPKLMWMLDPNTSTDPTIKTMGLATSVPAVARVNTASSSTVKDVLFLSGGYSNNELDALVIGNNTAPAKLGRSILALDVLDGSHVKLYDFVNNGSLAGSFPNMGAIASGVYPMEFIVGSYKAQRVYFGDQSGGVYALGSMGSLTAPYTGWRLDSSNIDQWTTDGSLNVSTTPGNPGVRWIYKGQATVASGKVTAASPISVVPTAYRLATPIAQFRRPAGSANAPNMIPPVVAVTFGTGDRNDPMDLDPINPVASRVNRQVMIFDRQDSADLPTAGGLPSSVDGSGTATTDAQLADLTSVSSSTPGDTSYLGDNKYLGYYLAFHTPTVDPTSGQLLYEKAYLNSIVVSGGLFFSTFRPGKTGSTVVCQGAGQTYTFRMCDALAPVFNNEIQAAGTTTDKKDAGCSGWVVNMNNLASPLTAYGTNAVLQSGEASGITGAAKGDLALPALKAPDRVKAFNPRSWRIIR